LLEGKFIFIIFCKYLASWRAPNANWRFFNFSEYLYVGFQQKPPNFSANYPTISLHS